MPFRACRSLGSETSILGRKMLPMPPRRGPRVSGALASTRRSPNSRPAASSAVAWNDRFLNWRRMRKRRRRSRTPLALNFRPPGDSCAAQAASRRRRGGAAGEARGVVGEHVSLSCGEVAHNRPAGTRNPAIAWDAGLAMDRPAQGFPPGIGTGRNWPLALSKPATANGDICTSRTQ